MSKVDDIKIGDSIFSIKGTELKEWKHTGFNPNNTRFLILLAKEDTEIRQIHWKDLDYGDVYSNECFSLTKEEVVERFKNYTSRILKGIREDL